MVSSFVSARFLYGFPYRFQRAWTVLCSMKHPLDVVRVGAWNSLHRVHLFSKANWDDFKARAEAFRDSFLSTPETSVEQKWSSFKKFIDDILSSVPSRMSSTRRHVPWMNWSILRLCRRKQRLYRKARKDHKDRSWEKYKACKRDCIRQLRWARSGYISNIIGAAFKENNTQPFWKFVKSCKNDSPGVAPLKRQGVLHSDSATKA